MPSGLARKGCLLVQEIRRALRSGLRQSVAYAYTLVWLGFLAMSPLHLVPDRKVDGTAHRGPLTQ
jgi:hypothetical protein